VNVSVNARKMSSVVRRPAPGPVSA
jgi:hypothetical protein